MYDVVVAAVGTEKQVAVRVKRGGTKSRSGGLRSRLGDS